MRNVMFTVMLLGLLTGASFAQRSRAPMGGRGVTDMGPYSHTNPIGPTPEIVRPNAIQMAPVAKRPVAAAPQTNTGSAQSQSGVGNDQRIVAPPDAGVGPNVSRRKLQR